jgi:hypothetical protein
MLLRDGCANSLVLYFLTKDKIGMVGMGEGANKYIIRSTLRQFWIHALR